MAPTKAKKLSEGQSTLNFKRTKSNTPSTSVKEKEKAVKARTKATVKKTVASKKVVKASGSESIDEYSSDEESSRASASPSISSSVGSVSVKSKGKGKIQEEKAVEEKIERAPLNPNKYSKLFGEAKAVNNGLRFVHEKNKTNVHHILTVFDMSTRYGPCVGMTRLQRWERAYKYGLNPPMEIKEMLESKEGFEQDSYKQSSLYGEL